jgi:beta-lactamase regulating signal transducer with metallopeptidase domain
MHDLLFSAATWWLGTALCGGLILLAACLAMRAIGQPALRQRLGELAVVAALAVAVLRLGPAWWSVPWPAATAPATGDDATTWSVEMTALPVWVTPAEGVWVEVPHPEGNGEWVQTSRLNEPPSTPEPPLAAGGWDWRPWVVGLTAAYLAVAGLLTVRWLLGQWALGRLVRQGRPASMRVRKLFTLMAFGTVWPLPVLRLSRRLRVPVCFGLRQPTVVLPEVLDYTADETALRWVFAHELTHLRRRDPWSYWALGLAQAVYFYLPWFWWLRRQVHLCQEYIADAAAAREGAAADEYAEFLVSLAKRPATPLGATGLGSSSDLMRRVQMLLNSTTRVQGTCPRRWSVVTAGGFFGLAVLLSGLGLHAQTPKDGDQKEVQQKKVIILDQDDLKGGKLIIDGKDVDVLKLLSDDVLKLVPAEMNVIVDVLDGGQAKKVIELVEKDGQPDKKRSITIVIDVDGKKVTIPIDGDLDAAKIKAAVEKALAAAKKQAGAADKAPDAEILAERLKALAVEQKAIAERQGQAARAQAKDAQKKAVELRARVLADQKKADDPDVKSQLEAAQKALKAVEKQLDDEHFKALMKKLEELKASKGVDAEQIRKGVADKLQALQQQGQLRVAPGEGARWIFRSGAAGGGRLGVAIEQPSAVMADQLDLPKNQGLVIVDVAKDSPAAKAGLRANDILLEVDGQAVSNDPGAFAKQIQELKAGESFNAVVLRKGKKERIRNITLPEGKGDEGDVRFRVVPKIEGFPGGKLDLQIEPPKVIIPAVPKVPAVPAAPRPPVAPKVPAPPRRVLVAPKTEQAEKSSSTSVSIEIKDGQFKAVQKDGDVTITVTGKAIDGKVNVGEITIQDGDEKSSYKELSRVPEKYRDRIKKLISNASDAPVRFEFRKSDGNVRGTIRQVEGDLATIAPGGDAGVTIGTKMAVFHLQPRPEYLGEIEIIKVEPQQAVGRLFGPRHNRIKQGDEVMTGTVNTDSNLPATYRAIHGGALIVNEQPW